jgi:hypothetical protein
VLAVVNAQITGLSLHQGVVAAHDAVEQSHGLHVRGVGDAALAGFLFFHYGLLSVYIGFKLLIGELSRG